MVALTEPSTGALITQHLDFARDMAQRLSRRLPACADADAIESDALVGLVQAARAFNAARGTRFRTYAARRIHGAMLDGLRRRQHLRHQKRPVPFRSLDAVVGRCDGRDVTLGELMPSDEPPVGSELEARDELRAILRQLDTHAQRLLRETHVAGLQQKQIAARLGITSQGVAYRMRRIRARLDQIIAERN